MGKEYEKNSSVRTSSGRIPLRPDSLKRDLCKQDTVGDLVSSRLGLFLLPGMVLIRRVMVVGGAWREMRVMRGGGVILSGVYPKATKHYHICFPLAGRGGGVAMLQGLLVVTNRADAPLFGGEEESPAKKALCGRFF